jgi:hypothetical protein
MKTLKLVANSSAAELSLIFLPFPWRNRSQGLEQWKRARGIRLCVVLLAACSLSTTRADDYHVSTAQQLQNALTQAAASSVSNNIYVTNGYYIGNFNFNSSSVNSLTILNEPNVDKSQIVLDSGGTGSSMNLSGSATANMTVQGMTFLRDSGSGTVGGLQIAGGNTAILVSGCSFLSLSNSTGIGLSISSGSNATMTNCSVTGTTGGGGGTGLSISAVSNVTIQSCTFVTNSGISFGGGLYVSGSSMISIIDSAFVGNTTLGPGASSFGGGAYCNGTTIFVSGNTFVGNSLNPSGYNGGYGAGGVFYGTTLTLSGNTFSGNSALTGCQYGGGAFCSGATITVSNNNFISNSAAIYGAGIYCSGAATLVNNSFVGNSLNAATCGYGSPAFGGGAYCGGTTTALFANTFTSNSAAGAYNNYISGGGLYCSSTILTASNNVFTGNTASLGSSLPGTPTYGGGVYASGSQITLLNNLVANNSVNSTVSQGGGIWVDASSNLFMINNTVTGNSSAGSGGGAAFILAGTVEVLNVFTNIIWGNAATVNGGDVYHLGTGATNVFVFNDASSYSGIWGTSQNNIDSAPQFFNPTGGDYHFPGGSPCANAGTNGAPYLPLTDLDGNSRTNNAGFVDMGCYEFNTSATHPADANADFLITAAEFNAYAAAWKNGQAWTNAPLAIPANYVTRAGYLLTNGGAYTNDGSARPVNWKPNR